MKSFVGLSGSMERSKWLTAPPCSIRSLANVKVAAEITMEPEACVTLPVTVPEPAMVFAEGRV